MTQFVGLTKWVLACPDRARHAATLLAMIIGGAVLIVGEVLLIAIVVSTSPVLGALVGLLTAGPATYAVVRARRQRR